MGIATWTDLATQNAIEKHDKNKCRPQVWEIQIRNIWAGHLFSYVFSIVLVDFIFSSVCHRNVVRSKSGNVAIPMGFSTWRFSNSGHIFAFLFARSKSTLLKIIGPPRTVTTHRVTLAAF